MIETVLLVFIISTIKKIEIKNALKDWSVLLVLLTVVIYIILQSMIFTNNYSLIKYSWIFKAFTFFCYYIMAYKNKLYKYIMIAGILILIGSGLNYIVTYINNGYMPIFPSLTYATGYTHIDSIGINGDFHVLGNNKTKMIWFADIFDWGYCIASIGDIIIRISMGILLFQTIKLKGDRMYDAAMD